MHIKRCEWSKTNVFHQRKKKFSCEKYLLTDTLAKMSQYIFAYFSISEHTAFFLYFRKKNFWLRPGVPPPPPITDWSIIIGFFTLSLRITTHIQNNYAPSNVS